VKNHVKTFLDFVKNYTKTFLIFVIISDRTGFPFQRSSREQKKPGSNSGTFADIPEVRPGVAFFQKFFPAAAD
jgi:hypothetical protein